MKERGEGEGQEERGRERGGSEREREERAGERGRKREGGREREREGLVKIQFRTSELYVRTIDMLDPYTCATLCLFPGTASPVSIWSFSVGTHLGTTLVQNERAL